MKLLGLCGGICILDLICKQYVESHTEKIEGQTLCKDKIHLHVVHNHGLLLNLLDTYPKAVKWVAGFAGIVLTGYQFLLFKKPGELWKKISIAFVAGGAWSNIYDRFIRGYVVDYFSFRTKCKKLNDIAFNLGDISIFSGCFLGVFASLFQGRS